MIVKVSILAVLAFLQASEVMSQLVQQPSGYGAYSGQQPSQGINPQIWNPSYWAAPYQANGINSWMDYIKMAQEAGKQFYQQWDKSGAAEMFGAGQQSSQQAEQAAMEATKVAHQAAKMGMDFAKQFFG